MDKGIGARFRQRIARVVWTPSRYPCRCTRCGARVNTLKQPGEYVRRPPKCPRGCRITTHDGQRTFAPLRIDWYRMAAEWRGAKPCQCSGYPFPHAKGRGYCDHNPNLTAEDLQDRHESRPRRH